MSKRENELILRHDLREYLVRCENSYVLDTDPRHRKLKNIGNVKRLGHGCQIIGSAPGSVNEPRVARFPCLVVDLGRAQFSPCRNVPPPLTQLEELAEDADIDASDLRAWLEAEIERRQVERESAAVEHAPAA